jgi:hypothetical protein
MAANFGMQIAPAVDRIGGLCAKADFDPYTTEDFECDRPLLASIRIRNQQCQPHDGPARYLSLPSLAGCYQQAQLHPHLGAGEG